MKQLTDAERLEVAMLLLSEHEDLDTYAAICRKREQGCEANGFHNVPAECEDKECKDCCVVDTERRKIDCPYVDYWVDNRVL